MSAAQLISILIIMFNPMLEFLDVQLIICLHRII